MRYIVGIICLITSLLLCACSEDDEKGAERYSGVFLSMEAIDAITPEDSFSDVILHNVEFEKVEVGKGEVDEYDLLSGFLQFGKQTALDRRKFDGFAVTSLEAGNVNMHFLTFHCRGYTSGKDDNICLFYLVYGLFQVNGNFASHVKIECGITVAESKINLDTIFFSGFCLEGVDFGLVFEIHACGNFLAVN